LLATISAACSCQRTIVNLGNMPLEREMGAGDSAVTFEGSYSDYLGPWVPGARAPARVTVSADGRKMWSRHVTATPWSMCRTEYRFARLLDDEGARPCR
jgi:hypothetical protein